MNTIPGFEPFLFQIDNVKKIIDHALFNNGVCVFDDTGLGKTITTVTALVNLGLNKVLISAPRSSHLNWIEVLKQTDIDYVLTSNKIPKDEMFDAVVVDEAHRVKSLKSELYYNLFYCIKTNKAMTFLLTATPFQNNVAELKTMVSLIDFRTNTPGFVLLGEYFKAFETQDKIIQNIKRFNGEIGDPGYSFKTIVKNVEAEHLARKFYRDIAKLFGTFSVYNTRDSIVKNYPDDAILMGHFPEVEENNIELKLNVSGNVIIKTLINKIFKLQFPVQNSEIEFGEENEKVDVSSILKHFLLKRMDSSHLGALQESIQNMIEKCKDVLNSYDRNDFDPIYIDKVSSEYEQLISIKASLDSEYDNFKLNQLCDVLRNIHKAVIFTEYKMTAFYITQVLKNRGYKTMIATELTDSVLEKIRFNFDANLPEVLQEDDIDILVCTDALSEGVNLHRANTLIHYDQRWNPSRIKQRNGRVNRILKNGVKRKIKIYSFDVESITENIIKLEKRILHKQDYGKDFLEHLNGFQFSKFDGFKIDRLFYADFNEPCYFKLIKTERGVIAIKNEFAMEFGRGNLEYSKPFDFDALNFMICDTDYKVSAPRIGTRFFHIHNNLQLTNLLYHKAFEIALQKAKGDDAKTKFENFVKTFFRGVIIEPLQYCEFWLGKHKYMNYEHRFKKL